MSEDESSPSSLTLRATDAAHAAVAAELTAARVAVVEPSQYGGSGRGG